jgi:sugar phosphate isomerase/epimerase
MTSRRNFIYQTTALAVGSLTLPSFIPTHSAREDVGVQLYTFRDAMTQDPKGTLSKVAELGFKQLESARSDKGLYYGLTPIEMRDTCKALGLSIRSGHVHLDADWNQTMEQAAEAGQEYVICSSMPTEGQDIDNYLRVAEAFNKAGEDCKKLGLKFGYHNHSYEFESDKGQVLYDVLLKNTDPSLVHMELDLGWVVMGGKNPIDYFKQYPGRFPLWHLKDMSLIKGGSPEFGKGDLNIAEMLENAELSGVKYMFMEQEEYDINPFESIQYNLNYLAKLGG